MPDGSLVIVSLPEQGSHCTEAPGELKHDVLVTLVLLFQAVPLDWYMNYMILHSYTTLLHVRLTRDVTPRGVATSPHDTPYSTMTLLITTSEMSC